QALLRLRPRERDDLSLVGWRDVGPARREADGAEHARNDRALPPDALFRGPYPLRFPAAGPRDVRSGSLVAASVRLGRRAAPGGDLPPLEVAYGPHHPRRPRLHGGIEHLPLQSSR